MFVENGSITKRTPEGCYVLVSFNSTLGEQSEHCTPPGCAAERTHVYNIAPRWGAEILRARPFA